MTSLKVIAVIPARYGSTRFPGKPLVSLKGKPLLQWVVEGTKTCSGFEEVYVATDDLRIQQLCQKIGVQCVMTSTECPTGTDRLFQATQDLDFDVVINVQGDEPMINATYLSPLIKAFADDSSLDMATLSHPLSQEDLENKNAVKVITNCRQEAIYFSRFPIPYSRTQENVLNSQSLVSAAQKHIGLYGYRKSFLQKFCSSSVAEIEKYESLEQLRALYLGARIKVISVQKPTYGVDTPEDLQKLEALLK